MSTFPDPEIRLDLVDVVPAPGVTHFHYRVIADHRNLRTDRRIALSLSRDIDAYGDRAVALIDLDYQHIGVG